MQGHECQIHEETRQSTGPSLLRERPVQVRQGREADACMEPEDRKQHRDSAVGYAQLQPEVWMGGGRAERYL